VLERRIAVRLLLDGRRTGVVLGRCVACARNDLPAEAWMSCDAAGHRHDDRVLAGRARVRIWRRSAPELPTEDHVHDLGMDDRRRCLPSCAEREVPSQQRGSRWQDVFGQRRVLRLRRSHLRMRQLLRRTVRRRIEVGVRSEERRRCVPCEDAEPRHRLLEGRRDLQLRIVRRRKSRRTRLQGRRLDRSSDRLPALMVRGFAPDTPGESSSSTLRSEDSGWGWPPHTLASLAPGVIFVVFRQLSSSLGGGPSCWRMPRTSRATSKSGFEPR